MKAPYWIAAALAAAAILALVLLAGRDGDGADRTADGALGAPTSMSREVDAPPLGDGGAVADVDPAEAGARSDGTGEASADGAPAEDAPAGNAPATPSSPAGGAERSGGEAGAAAPASSARAEAAQEPGTAELLRATAEAYRDVRAMRAEFDQQLDNRLLGRTIGSRGTLYQRAPDRFLMRFSDPEGDIIVSDGSQFWLYFPSTDPDQVIRARRGAQGLDLQSQFIGDPVARFDATYHGRETDRGRETHVLTLVPRQPLGYESLKVWIDDRDHLIRRFELTEGNGIVRRFALSNLRLNPSLSDELFEFTPPAGARVVDQG